jgi:hypothetical protein
MCGIPQKKGGGGFDSFEWERDILSMSNTLNISKCNITFKITNKSKFNNDYFKFNINYKSHIIVRRNRRELLYHYSLSIHVENRLRSMFLS